MKSVYVIKTNDGRVKIGVSKNPEVRINTIKNQAGVDVVDSYISELTDEAFDCEALAHRNFKGDRLSGEWFITDYDDVVDFIKSNISIKTIDSGESAKEIQDASLQQALDWAAGVSIRLKANDKSEFIFNVTSSISKINPDLASSISKLSKAEQYVACLEHYIVMNYIREEIAE